jgi:L-fuconolactonase
MDRMMYGSDWPVCLVAATYEKQVSIIENYISKHLNTEGGKIMGDNAKKFYTL